MEAVVVIVAIFLGLLVNILADNLPHHRSPRSPCCIVCGTPRDFGTWLAVIAMLRMKLRCSQCDSRRPWRDVLVELSLTFVGLWLYGRDPSPGTFWPALIVATIFILIVVIDIEYRLILHVVSGPAAVLILIMNSFDPTRGFYKSVAGGVAGFGIVFVLFLLGNLFGRYIARTHEEAGDEVVFGFGDVTLSMLLGLTVGWSGILLALVFAIFAGGIFSLFYMAVMTLRDRYNAFQPIPYGPFLIFGASLVYFFRETLVAFMGAG